MYLSLQKTYSTKNTEFKKTEKTIYRNKKANYLSTYRGSERGKGYSWKKKTKMLGYFFKKLIKTLINKDRLIKKLQTNLGYFLKMC